MPKTIVGLDLGHRAIRAVEVTPGGRRKPIVHRYHEAEIPEGAVQEGVVADEAAVVAALRWLWKVGGFSSKRVVIGMGSQQVLIRELTLPTMPQKHVKATLPFHVQELLPLPASEAVLDFFPIEEVDEDGPHVRGLLVAATRESVLKNIQALKAAGLQVVDVDLVPFAVTRLHVASTDERTLLVALVGAVSTSLVVVERGVPRFVRMLPSGSADITDALAERLGMQRERAEELKRRVGLSGTIGRPEEGVAQAVAAAGADEFAQSLRATATFWQNAHPETTVDAVILTGGGAALHGFGEHLEVATGIPVTVARPGDGLAHGSHFDEAGFMAAGAAPAVALGLALRSVS